MLTVLLVLQVIITVSMVIVILIQRNASDGMAGLAGGGNSLISGRASANILTKITSVLAAAFIINSLVMAAMTARSAKSEKSIIDDITIEQKAPKVPLVDAPVKNEPAATKKDSNKPATSDKETKPSVPIAE